MGFWDEWKKIINPGGKEGGRLKTGSLLLILLAVGAGLLLLNSFFSLDKKKELPPPAEPVESTGALWTEQQLTRRLAEILSKIRGVSEVELFLTPETSGRMELVTDREESRRQTSEGDSEGGNREIVEETSRSTYVVLRDSLGNEVPLVAEERKPLYRGVLVVAAGVDDPAVKARVIEALQVLLGLPAHRITVLPR
ncbi:MAG TPA: hypothetical protein PKV91_01465 [Bacillota bacterium]|nr:hypothetical protein [Bacillota bacterium]HOA35305.1 hypothetical protein [Bacillota bacterium]HOJ83397.1 hypothetical protein [Bacillota bacterium]HOL14763.1 hypothetical protein [Bacillota bacterium]HPZ11005.1 hypothetical protein [Bacillota bacterium]